MSSTLPPVQSQQVPLNPPLLHRQAAVSIKHSSQGAQGQQEQALVLQGHGLYQTASYLFSSH